MHGIAPWARGSSAVGESGEDDGRGREGWRGGGGSGGEGVWGWGWAGEGGSGEGAEATGAGRALGAGADGAEEEGCAEDRDEGLRGWGLGVFHGEASAGKGVAARAVAGGAGGEVFHLPSCGRAAWVRPTFFPSPHEHVTARQGIAAHGEDLEPLQTAWFYFSVV
jgi:hypothetical protein